MGKRRRVVIDNSILAEPFFPTMGRALAHQCTAVVAAIQSGDVIAFAPDLVYVEFMTVAGRWMSRRAGNPGQSADDATRSVKEFLQLPITRYTSDELADRAWDFVVGHHLSPTDAWYLACAEYKGAELWLSHRHADGFAEHARACYRNVYVLAEQGFHE